MVKHVAEERLFDATRTELPWVGLHGSCCMSNSLNCPVYFDALQPHDDIAVPGGIVAFLEEFQVSHGLFRIQQRMNEKLCVLISSSLRDYIPVGSVQPNFKRCSKSTRHK